PPTHIYTLSLHDALPIYIRPVPQQLLENVTVIAIDHPHVVIGDLPRLDIDAFAQPVIRAQIFERADIIGGSSQVRLNDDANIGRSEEHTSELQSRFDLVC